ncbi:MAG: amidohydrolase family protein [Gemmatales bacterium]|nr:amidohydrolase family protein [Gemmatales bacterium]MDW8387762.1 amidohydrolase family protein [Gemmatales bacterium]
MRCFAFCVLLCVPVLAAAQQTVVIHNAVVETLGPAGRLEGATVILRDGKIAAVGKDVPVPDFARVIDAQGGTLMPGIVDPYFQVAITPASSDSGERTTVIRGRPFPFGGGFGGRTASAFTRIADNFYPYDPGLKPLPRVGICRANVVSSGVGQAAVIRCTPDQPETMLVQPDGPIYASVTNSTESLDQIRSRLQRGSRGSGPAPTGSATAPAPSAALNDPWKDVLEGKKPLLVEANTAAAVVHVVKFLQAYPDVKLVLFVAGDAVPETLPLLKERKVCVVLRPRFDFLPASRDRFSAPRMLHENGVEVVFSLTARPPRPPAITPPTQQQQQEEEQQTVPGVERDFPLFPVAMQVKTGLPRQIALEALTKKPAALLGCEKTHGSIEPGKAADLLLFTGDPLDPASRLRLTIIDGRITHAQ